MSYQLKATETVPEGIKRIIEEELDNILEGLTQQPDGLEQAVHDSRKRFKKIRAALRLVRAEVGEKVYKKENRYYREASHRISTLRDGYVKARALEGLVQHFSGELGDQAFAPVRKALWADYEVVRQKGEEEAVTEVAETVREARDRIKDWPFKHDGFSALAKGLKQEYKRGRQALAAAYKDPTPGNFHEWRKRVKDLWYQTRLLKPLWPELIAPLADQIHAMADDLGELHDLDELQRTLSERKDLFESKKERQLLWDLIDHRSTELKACARPIGERIYAEKPQAFSQRLANYWQVWQA
jgi:CHAD domain-containing protein